MINYVPDKGTLFMGLFILGGIWALWRLFKGKE